MRTQLLVLPRPEQPVRTGGIGERPRLGPDLLPLHKPPAQLAVRLGDAHLGLKR
jgi:hypothetical protein